MHIRVHMHFTLFPRYVRNPSQQRESSEHGSAGIGTQGLPGVGASREKNVFPHVRSTRTDVGLYQRCENAK